MDAAQFAVEDTMTTKGVQNAHRTCKQEIAVVQKVLEIKKEWCKEQEAAAKKKLKRKLKKANAKKAKKAAKAKRELYAAECERDLLHYIHSAHKVCVCVRVLVFFFFAVTRACHW